MVMRSAKFLVLVLSGFLTLTGLIIKNQSEKINSQNFSGQVAGSRTSFIENLPADLPLYPSATISSVLQKKDGWLVSLETSTVSTPALQTFFDQKLGSLGWQKSGQNYLKDSKMISWQITQNEDKSQTVILLNYVLVPTK